MRRCFLSCTLARTGSITAATRASFVILGVASYLEIPDASHAMLLGLAPSGAAQSNAFCFFSICAGERHGISVPF